MYQESNCMERRLAVRCGAFFFCGATADGGFILWSEERMAVGWGLPPPYQSSVCLVFLVGLRARVWWFYLFACETNGGSKPPPYTIDRLILWSDGRPPKTLSLFNAGNSFFAHGFCGLRDWRTLFSLRIARVWSDLVDGFYLFPSVICSPN